MHSLERSSFSAIFSSKAIFFSLSLSSYVPRSFSAFFSCPLKFSISFSFSCNAWLCFLYASLTTSFALRATSRTCAFLLESTLRVAKASWDMRLSMSIWALALLVLLIFCSTALIFCSLFLKSPVVRFTSSNKLSSLSLCLLASSMNSTTLGCIFRRFRSWLSAAAWAFCWTTSMLLPYLVSSISSSSSVASLAFSLLNSTFSALSCSSICTRHLCNSPLLISLFL
mmetsp:Transcript_10162/g.20582  ORF Transcript_10162/g.20582 Transcript_10162/m.20582 type:complete len:226 (-) Transcript_10162:1518-2195(-)